MRFNGMPLFRIYYFRDNVLEHGEEIELRSVLEAIERAADADPALRAEIWSAKGRVGIVGPSPVRHTQPPRRKSPKAEPVQLLIEQEVR